MLNAKSMATPMPPINRNDKRGHMNVQAHHMPACEMNDDAQQAVFHWDILKDRLFWNKQAHAALQLDPGVDISSNRAFLLLVDSSHADVRHEAMNSAMERGQREYVISYRFMPQGRGEDRGFMVVERGWWTTDAHGKPAHVFGTIRRMNCTGESTCAIPGMPEMDPSSGLYCRSYFFRRLENFLSEDAPRQRHAALLLISLRNYSIIFDAYGFEAADTTYAELARRINQVLRAGDICARYSESRIALLIHDCAEEDLKPAMHRFLQAPMQEPIATSHAPVWPVLAMGAVLLPQQARGLTEAITCAEEALSEAEARPGNNAVVFSATSSKTSQRAIKARHANEIFDALRRRRFTLAFQPIVKTNGDILCHEALLRVFNDHDEAVSAAHLIPVAEELGLIRQVDMEVLILALQALKENEGCLAINISPMTVLDAEEFLEELSCHADLVRNRLIIEITESAALDNAEKINHVINRLHQLGCKVALDDFGAGYTSFRNLRDFHFDFVKIDGAFCENLSRNTQNQHFVRSLIELAHNINIQVIAEWVEHEEDAALLRRWGVHALQGYLFGAAVQDGPWRAPCLTQPEQQTLVLPAEKARAVSHAGKEPEKAAAGKPSSSAAPQSRSPDISGPKHKQASAARPQDKPAQEEKGGISELMRELLGDMRASAPTRADETPADETPQAAG